MPPQQKTTVWLNTVGTYAIGSAAYFWGRFAAGALVRLPHYLFGETCLEDLLFADDFIWIALTQLGVGKLGMLVYVLSALGVVFKWEKFRGGTEGAWIGYYVDLRGYSLGISSSRAHWLAGWLRQRTKEGKADLNDLAAVLGRLGFALAPLEHIRPFVAPLYAWSSAVGHAGVMQLPWSVLFLMHYLAEYFEGPGRMVEVFPRGNEVGELFRADAKAEGQSVWVGGWEVAGGRLASSARWFSVELTRAIAPWAFGRGEPFRTVASLELFATLLCVICFGDAWACEETGTLVISGTTDNRGNTQVVTKLMTSKFPLVVILTEWLPSCSSDTSTFV